MAACGSILSFMKIGTDVPAVLRLYTSDISEAVMLVLLMEEIYELRRWDGVKCHDKYTTFNQYWFRHSKVNGGDTHRNVVS
jgi:hypothetical protein